MCHLLPALESGLFQMVQTALLGVQHRPECCGERVKVTYQLRTMGKSWCFSGPLLAHFVKRRDSLLCPHWHVLCVPASSSRNRKTWHSSLQSQSKCMVRDLTHCIYFKTYKKKLYSKINMKLPKQFYTVSVRVFWGHASWPPNCRTVWWKKPLWSLGLFFILKSLKLNTSPALWDSSTSCI